MLENPKNTVDYDEGLAERIEHRVASMGADGKLVLDANGEVYQVNLLEKLLVPLLSKLGNLVIDGGIWMNTQRPEWNDANNALVGQGLSMVTLYYMRRYVRFLQQLLAEDSRIDRPVQRSEPMAGRDGGRPQQRPPSAGCRPDQCGATLRVARSTWPGRQPLSQSLFTSRSRSRER